MRRNNYNLKWEDFVKVITVASAHVVFYTMLDDRVHIEMPIENAVLSSQKFFSSMLEERRDNVLQDPIKLFFKIYFAKRTYYRYYVNDEEKAELKNIKLYDRLITSFVNNEIVDEEEEAVNTEYDDKIEVSLEDDPILELRKE